MDATVLCVSHEVIYTDITRKALSLLPMFMNNKHFSYSGDFSIPEVEEVHEVEEVDVPCVPDAEEEQGKS